MLDRRAPKARVRPPGLAFFTAPKKQTTRESVAKDGDVRERTLNATAFCRRPCNLSATVHPSDGLRGCLHRARTDVAVNSNTD